MKSLKSKLIISNLVILTIVIVCIGMFGSRSLTQLSEKVLSLNNERAMRIQDDLKNVSKTNIEQISDIFKQALESKSKNIILKDAKTIFRMYQDNSFMELRDFLAKSYQSDKEMLLASFFVVEGKSIKAWQYISHECEQGMELPVAYDYGSKKWLGRCNHKKIQIPDPEISEIVSGNELTLKLRKRSISQRNGENKVISFYDAYIPIVENQDVSSVRKMRKANEPIGYLRYIISLSGMENAVVAEENELNGQLKVLEDQNIHAERKAKVIVQETLRDILLFLVAFLAICLVCSGILLRYVSDRITNPLLILTKIAKKMAKGDYKQDIKITSNDEIGLFAETFKEMSVEIMRRDEDLASLNKNLESLVEKRTHELMEERDNVTTILNNIKQAIFNVDESGTIVPPVSLHASNIFKTEITGKNIYSVLFNSIPKTCETYSLLNTALCTVYGESELQWSLMEENLPKRIEIGNVSSNEKQILKINYTPIWDEKGSLKNIMYVIEDITLIEKLEDEIVEHQIANEKKMKVLNELSSCSGADTSILIGQGLDLLDSIHDDLLEMSSSQERIKEVLRGLHSLKGNSRALGLSYISSTIHEVEGSIIKVKEHLDSGHNKIPEELETNITESCSSAYGQLHEYSHYLETIFKIENGHTSENLMAFHQSLVYMESELSHFFPNGKTIVLGVDSRNDSPSSSFWDYLRKNHEDDATAYRIRVLDAVKEMIEVAKKIDNNFIVPNAVSLKQKLDGKYPEDFTKERVAQVYQSLFALCRTFKGIYQKSQMFKSSYANMDWVEILNGLIEITENYTDDMNSHGKSSDLSDCVQRARKKAAASSLELIQRIFDDMETTLNEYSDINKSPFFFHLKRAWANLALVSYIDVGSRMDKEQIDSYRNFMMSIGGYSSDQMKHKYAICAYDTDKASILDTLFTLQLATPKQFFESARVVFQVPALDILNKFIPHDSLSGVTESALEFLYNFSFEKKDIHWSRHHTHFFFHDLLEVFTSVGERQLYLITLDLQRLLAPHVMTEFSIKHRPSDVVTVPISNLDKMKNLVKRNLLSNYPSSKGYKEILDLLGGLSNFSVKMSFGRYFSMVDDISKRLNKKIMLQISGEDFTLTKEKMALLHDAITPILRNAIDHGIESPEERHVHGKPEKGQICITISKRNDIPQIEISDDGKGIDSEQIKMKALKMRLISEDDAAKLTEHDLMKFVFVPYLSSKEVATDVSGRGMGMDIASLCIKKMGGSIDVESQKEQGTKIIIRLDRLVL